MGASCCCLRNEDFSILYSPDYKNCICFSCFFGNFPRWYASLFHGGEHALPSSTQEINLSSTVSLVNYSEVDTYRSPPRSLHYDADPRYFRLQRHIPDSRTEKGSSHLNEETEPLRSSEIDEDSESSNTPSKWKCEEGWKEYTSSSSLKYPIAETNTEVSHMHSSSEDEDVCPTCLEEYTKDNPKIATKCSHHFHLGCIYEWMEKSDTCPVCSKVMAFDEIA